MSDGYLEFINEIKDMIKKKEKEGMGLGYEEYI